MKHSVLLVFRSEIDKALLLVLKRLQASRIVTYHELRQEIARSTLFHVLRYIDEINREVSARTGVLLFVRLRKRVGPRNFENALRIHTDLHFKEVGALVLVTCVN